eukprot:TRINITY_DN1256_c0_g1_i1.p2 TRINITY_DN1256_c0_g1~~TRINITY_DN1256_c0_g1_i1.p2  ORF type:complete len:138 (+),score=65.90 TRINITY_DN1256_c0_g1_i1:95-508(+)
MAKEYTWAEVHEHNKEDDCWLVMKTDDEYGVYDVTKYMSDHPGGADTLNANAGYDATADFDGIGHPQNAKDIRKKLRVGKLTAEEAAKGPQRKPAPAGSASGERKDSGGGGRLAFIILLIAIAVYFYNQQQQQQQQK